LNDTSKKVRLTWQWKPAAVVAQDYTWMSSPANASWDGSSANWNDGAAWADGNNAIFGASSQTTVAVPVERLVNDLKLNDVAYTFNGTGPLRVAGTITPTGAKDQNFNVPLASGRDDGSLHFSATGVDWRSAYLNSVNNLQEKTVLAGTVFLMAKGDGSFGKRQPDDFRQRGILGQRQPHRENRLRRSALDGLEQSVHLQVADCRRAG